MCLNKSRQDSGQILVLRRNNKTFRGCIFGPEKQVAKTFVLNWPSSMYCICTTRFKNFILCQGENKVNNEDGTFATPFSIHGTIFHAQSM